MEREKLNINPLIATILTSDDIVRDIPLNKIKANADLYGTLLESSITDPMRNTRWRYLKFNDISLFTPAADAFRRSERAVKGTPLSPKYTPHLKGTTSYKRFWKEEINRCIEGYEPLIDGEPCGLRITGEHYFYLNYCRMTLAGTNEKTGERIEVEDFPRFAAMDYYWFNELEARENPGKYGLPLTYKKSLIAAKARRKGFSYKAAGGAVWKTVLNKNTKVAIVSETGEDAGRCFEKCLTIIDFLSEYTELGMPTLDPKSNGGWVTPISRTFTKDRGHIIIGRKNTKTGAQAGRRSEIFTISLHNQPDKTAGAGVSRLIFEEAGKITDLMKAWTFAEPTLRSGDIYKGIAIIFGTGGDMGSAGKKGSSRDFSEMFNNPEGYNLAAFDNIWEPKAKSKKCGWFIDDMWFKESDIPLNIDGKEFYPVDKLGNAYRWVAEIKLNMERKIKKAGKKTVYNDFLTQHCKTPSEAFLQTQGAVFPTADLFARLSGITAGRLGFEAFRQRGELVNERDNVYFKPDLDGILEPVDTLGYDDENKEGCILQYEKPMKINGTIPPDAYIISVDPIGQNTDTGKSLCSIVVMKTPKYHNFIGPEKIVMTYRGRSKTNPMGHVQELLMKMSMYYNAKVTYENDRDGGILQYFIRKGELHRLMSKPARVMSKYIPNSKTLAREFGHSMASQRHKAIGEQMLNEWLLSKQPKREIVDSDGEVRMIEGLRNLDILEDRAILEELIAYNREDNFDMAMALMGAVIQLHEWFYFEEDIKEQTESVSDYWNDKFVDLYGTEKEKWKLTKQRKTRASGDGLQSDNYYKMNW